MVVFEPAKIRYNNSVNRLIFSGEGVIVQFDSGIKTELLPVETSQYACKVEKDEDGEEKIIIFKSGSFTQLPLIPGYAITIHRSQGMTLSGVVLMQYSLDNKLGILW